jgi:hypothetical protein
VLCEWEDAYSDHSAWMLPEEAGASGLVVVTSVGLCVKVTQRAIYLVQDQHPDGVHGVGGIPLRGILRLARLVEDGHRSV